jgi:hypothetical protein
MPVTGAWRPTSFLRIIAYLYPLAFVRIPPAFALDPNHDSSNFNMSKDSEDSK